MDTKKVGLVVAIGALAVAIVAIYLVLTATPGKGIPVGSIGTILVEDYVPVIKYNDGYYSNLEMTVNGTSTIALSYDGFIANANFTMATGTAKAVFTNRYGVNMMCYGGGILADSLSTTLGPAFVVSLGTSTSATGYSTGLLASSTIATTTDELDPLIVTTFRLGSGESIVGALSDGNGLISSSTYYGSSYWNVDFNIPCTIVD